MAKVESLVTAVTANDQESRKRNADMFREQVAMNTKFTKLEDSFAQVRNNMNSLLGMTDFLMVRLATMHS